MVWDYGLVTGKYATGALTTPACAAPSHHLTDGNKSSLCPPSGIVLSWQIRIVHHFLFRHRLVNFCAMACTKTGNRGWNDPPSIGGMAGGCGGEAVNGASPNGGSGAGAAPNDAAATSSRQFILAELRRWQERCAATLSARHAADMERHLAILRAQLESGALSAPLVDRLHALLVALAEAAGERGTRVHDAQSQIILNHASEISSWMLGIKRLVHEAGKLGSS